MNNKAFGAIVGRWQTPYLHEGHKHIIDQVYKEHENVIIFVGVQPGQPSRRNPLDFQTRKVMILESYPEATVLPLPDKKSDKKWSEQLDARLKEAIGHHSAILYGSRDSFIPHYSGNFEVKELESPDTFVSATAIREEVIRKAKNSLDFRAGVIYAMYNRFPSPYTTTDLAIIRSGKVLLVQKPEEEGWRFLGGFLDNGDPNFEAAIRREAREEIGISMELVNFEKIMDTRVDEDWRYKATDEKIFTTLFVCACAWGEPEPADDIKYAKWVAFEDLHKEKIEPEHKVLMERFIDYASNLVNGKLKERI